MICRQAAHRARRRRSVSQPEHVKRPFQSAMRELVGMLCQQADRLNHGMDRYGTDAKVLVELANAVRDVAAAHDRTVGDSWSAVARRVDTTPAKAQEHCEAGMQLVVSLGERTRELAEAERDHAVPERQRETA